MADTVLMKKGDKFADIYDSPETIAQAKRDNYHLCDDREQKEHDALLNPMKTATDKPDISKATKNVMLAYAEKEGIYTPDMDGMTPKDLRACINEILEKNPDKNGKNTSAGSTSGNSGQNGQE